MSDPGVHVETFHYVTPIPWWAIAGTAIGIILIGAVIGWIARSRH